ncbi:MAG: hypothetical protein D6B25_05180 [Desulfobulbaceae bacterium]|nr:MAG: hypothetical protein D6B25_05180 [Desulfobulbaceae bacterium]
MATRKRQPAKIKFELTRSGIGGIAIVCFCIFLWMFLLGVWTGQSLLKPAEPVSAGFEAGEIQDEKPIVYLKAEQKKRKP